MSELTTLLERVEAATEPDRVLDAAIYDAFCSHATQEFTEWDSRHDFTHSIDTVLALVNEKLPGWKVSITTWSSENEKAPRARVFKDSVFDAEWARAATLPRAILSALLRALIAQSKEQAHG